MKLQWLKPDADEAPLSVAELERSGVHYMRLDPDPMTYGPALERVRQERGYVAQDIVELHAGLPNLEGVIDKFKDEHHHADDEVRYVLEGEGIFDIRSADDRWMRVTVEAGDLIIVPAGTHHRFTLTARKEIRCVRLFQDPEGWVPHYRENAPD